MTTKDLPDYTREMVIKYTGGFIGLEELAARLGSIVPWDLKGNAVFIEDFETEETEWTLDEGGGSSLASRQTRRKYSGDWAIKLLVDDVANAYALITHNVHLDALAKYGLFCRFLWDENCQRITFRNHFTFSGTNYYVGVRYSLPDTTLEIETGDDAWTAIDTALTISEATAIWYSIYLVFDLTTGKYVSLKIAEHEHNLSAHDVGGD